MDLRGVKPSRNVVDHTNYLTDPRMAGVDPDFINFLISTQLSKSPANNLMQERYQIDHPTSDALDALFRAAIQKYGRVKDSSSFDDFRR